VSAVAWVALVLAFLAAGMGGVALALAIDGRTRAREVATRLEELLVTLALGGVEQPDRPEEAPDIIPDPLRDEIRAADAYRKQRGR
jgi:hypothetical protein